MLKKPQTTKTKKPNTNPHPKPYSEPAEIGFHVLLKLFQPFNLKLYFGYLYPKIDSPCHWFLVVCEQIKIINNVHDISVTGEREACCTRASV